MACLRKFDLIKTGAYTAATDAYIKTMSDVVDDLSGRGSTAAASSSRSARPTYDRLHALLDYKSKLGGIGEDVETLIDEVKKKSTMEAVLMYADRSQDEMEAALLSAQHTYDTVAHTDVMAGSLMEGVITSLKKDLEYRQMVADIDVLVQKIMEGLQKEISDSQDCLIFADGLAKLMEHVDRMCIAPT